MRTTSIILVFLSLISCGNEAAEQSVVVEQNTPVAPYDTVAIDSFSQGATSVDIAQKIKMSSLKYQDSLKMVKLKNEEQQLLKKDKEEKLKAESKAKEALDKVKKSTATELPATQ